MLEVKTLSEVTKLIEERFGSLRTGIEAIAMQSALGRVLAQDLLANEHVPNFNRSTADGYALISADTYGCSESLPAILTVIGESLMGQHTHQKLERGQCTYVPTGGELPAAADAVVMLEHAEDFGDGTIGVFKPCAPGANLIFKGDDLKPGQIVYHQGRKLRPADIGTLAALGIAQIAVRQPPVIGLISTGDELVEAGQPLGMGQIYDVNDPMLQAAIQQAGARARSFGIFKDDPPAIKAAAQQAIQTCDGLILTGGTSVGTQDAIPAIIAELGKLLVHGVAAKPGKPTIVGAIHNKPVFGLPGNPLAAFFMFMVLVRPLICSMLGTQVEEFRVSMPLARAAPSNHGREDLLPVALRDGAAYPIMGKSGLITTLSHADGYIRIPREREGMQQGEAVEVILF